MCKDCRSDHYYKSKNLPAVKKPRRSFDYEQYIWDILINAECENCKLKDPRILEFDHINESNKEKNISQMKASSLEDLKNEISKCRILCPNCHMKRTQRQFNTWKSNRTVVSNPNENNLIGKDKIV